MCSAAPWPCRGGDGRRPARPPAAIDGRHIAAGIQNLTERGRVDGVVRNQAQHALLKASATIATARQGAVRCALRSRHLRQRLAGAHPGQPQQDLGLHDGRGDPLQRQPGQCQFPAQRRPPLQHDTRCRPVVRATSGLCRSNQGEHVKAPHPEGVWTRRCGGAWLQGQSATACFPALPAAAASTFP